MLNGSDHPTAKVKMTVAPAGYYKVRDGTRYVTKVVLVVAGARDDGYREILGVRITDCKNEQFWSGLFDELKERGLQGVQRVVSDGHTGIQKAAEAAFLGVSWQTRKTYRVFLTGRSLICRVCQVHCTRAALKNIPRKYKEEIAESLKEVYGDERRLQDLADDLRARSYRKADTVERFLPGLMSYTAFPKQHQKRIRTTNMMAGWCEARRTTRRRAEL